MFVWAVSPAPLHTLQDCARGGAPPARAHRRPASERGPFLKNNKQSIRRARRRRAERGGGARAGGAAAVTRWSRHEWVVCVRSGRRMRNALWAAAVAALLALAAPERRADTDFEFDEAPAAAAAAAAGGARRTRRYTYDPQSPLCRELLCKKRELCLLRDAFTAQCATKKEVLRRGDTIVAPRREHAPADEDVFYEARAPARAPARESDDAPADAAEDLTDGETDAEPDGEADGDDGQQFDRSLDRPLERCVGCGAGGAGGAQFVCGSDNRTYSSLCRLDLHNCVRRAAVRLACRGFCPCRPHRAAPRRSRDVSTSHPIACTRPAWTASDAFLANVLESSVHLEGAPEALGYALHRHRPASGRIAASSVTTFPASAVQSGHTKCPGACVRGAANVLCVCVCVQRAAGAAGTAGGGRRGSARGGSRGTEDCELDKMADRLLDWFSVLMEEAGGTPPPPRGFPRDCKPEVRWMFAHLDAARDGLLSRDDLYALRHDERERCLRPFLASCARGARGARAGRPARGLSRAAWCGCLRRAARPCSALARAHPDRSPGAYVPACDARGFYLPRQCHAALGVCWCVDAHGVERPASRTKGQPACPDERASEGGDDESGGAAGGAGAAPGPADDEDVAGSGDNELRF
ncbi:proteoglycan Cow [Battus philenor]|uniref:proteoglycan Cow n=1 Tax=Battus philenor TaxID=42288 RepID=UPI0035D11C9C